MRCGQDLKDRSKEKKCREDCEFHALGEGVQAGRKAARRGGLVSTDLIVFHVAPQVFVE